MMAMVAESEDDIVSKFQRQGQVPLFSTTCRIDAVTGNGDSACHANAGS